MAKRRRAHGPNTGKARPGAGRDGLEAVSVAVPQGARRFIERAADLMRAGEDPASALLHAASGPDRADPPPARSTAVSTEQVVLRDRRNMALLRARLEATEIHAAAALGRRLQSLGGWRRLLVRVAGIDA